VTQTRTPRGTCSFFEQNHHLHFLTKTIVTDLQAGATLGRARHVRIWSAACSTGEEPYSIAISLLETLPTINPWRIEILATDPDSAMLATATERIYDESAVTEIDLKTRYFLRGKGDMTGHIRVKQRLADLVHFQHLRLQTTPWPIAGKFDAIFFRNALDTFSEEMGERILRNMLLYLNPHAYLILGTCEEASCLRNAVIPLGQGIHQLRPHGKARYTGKERRIFLRTQRSPE
jgi:chemotaxis protein methyltransferase CheR